MKAKIILLIIGVTVFIATVIIYCFLSILPIFINMRESSIKSREELNNLSSILGVEANWGAVGDKIYCDILVEGETLDTIETALREITSIKVARDDDEYLYYTIYFTKPYVYLNAVGLNFDDKGHLIGKFRRVGLGGSDMSNIDCP
jgi:hypothetical protein